MSMTALMVAGTVISAVGQIRAGQAQKAMYQAQARQAEMQGRSAALRARQETLAYREEGIKALENTRRNMATINARGAAGALDPFSGSVGNIMGANLNEGVLDFNTALDNVAIGQANQDIAHGAAQFQAGIYRAAGRQAMQNAYFQAAGTLISGAAGAQQAGAFSGGGGGGGAPMPSGSYQPYQSLGGTGYNPSYGGAGGSGMLV